MRVRGKCIYGLLENGVHVCFWAGRRIYESAGEVYVLAYSVCIVTFREWCTCRGSMRVRGKCMY